MGQQEAAPFCMWLSQQVQAVPKGCKGDGDALNDGKRTHAPSLRPPWLCLHLVPGSGALQGQAQVVSLQQRLET